MNSKDVKWIIKNWDKISEDFKTDILPDKYHEKIDGLSREEHYVVLLLDRQKPSVESSYDFDEERIGVNKSGKIIWGFDSGCSCPMPWDDSYPTCYNVSKTWKEFEGNTSDFDRNYLKECDEKIKEIKKELEKGLK